MVVLPVDDGDRNRRTAQFFRSCDAAETCADDHDFRLFTRHAISRADCAPIWELRSHDRRSSLSIDLSQYAGEPCREELFRPSCGVPATQPVAVNCNRCSPAVKRLWYEDMEETRK